MSDDNDEININNVLVCAKNGDVIAILPVAFYKPICIICKKYKCTLLDYIKTKTGIYAYRKSDKDILTNYIKQIKVNKDEQRYYSFVEWLREQIEAEIVAYNCEKWNRIGGKYPTNDNTQYNNIGD